MPKLNSRALVFTAGVVCGILGSILFQRWTARAAVVAVREPDAIVAEPDNFLAAPAFKDPGVIKSSLQGWILVRWNEVKGAAQYQVTVTDKEGRQLRNFETAHTYTFLKNLTVNPKLRETPYQVRVVPVGQDGQKGKESEWKPVAMLPMRDLAPPSIKSISTEE